jgi:hypothetical protein
VKFEDLRLQNHAFAAVVERPPSPLAKVCAGRTPEVGEGIEPVHSLENVLGPQHNYLAVHTLALYQEEECGMQGPVGDLEGLDLDLLAPSLL